MPLFILLALLALAACAVIFGRVLCLLWENNKREALTWLLLCVFIYGGSLYGLSQMAHNVLGK